MHSADGQRRGFARRYGPWAVVIGASDGTGAEFARELARRGVNVAAVARRRPLLDALAAELEADHGIRTRVIAQDMSLDDAAATLCSTVDDLEVGCVLYNAGADDHSTEFLTQPLDDLRSMVRRNCDAVLEVSHRLGGRMVDQGRGALVLVTSGAAWVGGSHIAAYGATKAFDLILAEALWAEWRPKGVDVLALVLGATDTPSLRRSLERHGGDFGDLADPAQVAVETLDHLGDGPTWIHGSPDPEGASPFGAIPRRVGVEAMSAATGAMRDEGNRP